MLDLTLRPATEHDVTAIRSLIHRVRITPWGLDWRRFVLAVDRSGSVLGCGQLKPHGEGIVELASIAVEPEHEKRGIARALIEYLVSRAPRPLYLTCRSSLGPFYSKWGFRALPVEEMPPYYRRLTMAASLFDWAFAGSKLLVMMLQ